MTSRPTPSSRGAERRRAAAPTIRRRPHVAAALHAAAVYLGGRSLARGELSFDPADPRDEEMLDATIDLLVKEQLASIEAVETGDGHYIYRLEPNWAEIHSKLSQATEQADPEIADWFREGLHFIEEAFLAEADA